MFCAVSGQASGTAKEAFGKAQPFVWVALTWQVVSQRIAEAQGPGQGFHLLSLKFGHEDGGMMSQGF